MNVKILICLIQAIIGISGMLFCQNAVAHGDYPAELELTTESRTQVYDSSAVGHELVMGLGLGWTPNSWVSVYGHIELGWLAFPEGEFIYRYHNTENKVQHLGELGAAAGLGIHPGLSVLSILGELNARCYFAHDRAGMYAIFAGFGLRTRIDDWQNDIMSAVYFGAMFRFCIFDDFEKISSLNREKPEVSFMFGIGF